MWNRQEPFGFSESDAPLREVANLWGNTMFHALEYSVLGSDFGNDMIYVGFLAFMWDFLSLASYLDYRSLPFYGSTRRNSAVA